MRLQLLQSKSGRRWIVTLLRSHPFSMLDPIRQIPLCFLPSTQPTTIAGVSKLKPIALASCHIKVIYLYNYCQ
ncbi:MAG: hypothetical protein KME17_09915 [Cyanosarcina radialis HA8281-LM2]|nr:hypothetical protein [Cyanosarcina radialis HA8281-LM2]